MKVKDTYSKMMKQLEEKVINNYRHRLKIQDCNSLNQSVNLLHSKMITRKLVKIKGQERRRNKKVDVVREITQVTILGKGSQVKTMVIILQMMTMKVMRTKIVQMMMILADPVLMKVMSKMKRKKMMMLLIKIILNLEKVMISKKEQLIWEV